MSVLHVCTDEIPSVVVRFNCTKCGEVDAVGHCYDLKQTITAGYFVKVGQKTDTFIRCSACNKNTVMHADSATIAESTPEEIEDLRVKTSSSGRILAMVALPACWLPGLGLLLAIPAFLFNRKVNGGLKDLSMLALGLATVSTFVAGLYLAMGTP